MKLQKNDQTSTLENGVEEVTVRRRFLRGALASTALLATGNVLAEGHQHGAKNAARKKSTSNSS